MSVLKAARGFSLPLIEGYQFHLFGRMSVLVNTEEGFLFSNLDIHLKGVFKFPKKKGAPLSFVLFQEFTSLSSLAGD